MLEFLIPAYKRFDGAVKAAVSVASQVQENSLVGVVVVRIVDDASPGFSAEHLAEMLREFNDVITFSVNEINKGMSLNIYDMVATSSSQFCTILTDDDWLFPGCLVEIIDYLEQIADRSGVGGLFTPRYSYTEDGSLHCVVCQPCKCDKLLAPGPVNALRHCRNGFILTGFIFRPRVFASDAWKQNIQNSYFTIINFWGIMSSYSILFVNRNWFQHTVLNYCHWDSWGKSASERKRRLYTDYMDAVAFISEKSTASSGSIFRKLVVFYFEVVEYVRQMVSYMNSPAPVLSCRGRIVQERFAFCVSMLLAPFIWYSLRLRHFLGRMVRSLNRYIFAGHSKSES